MSFSVQDTTEGADFVLVMSGGLDEDASFAGLAALESGPVVLDLSGINAINSVGIREWIKWVKEIPSTVQLRLRNCPKIIVDQINMIAGFLPPKTVIESFFVPYFAEESGAEKMILFRNGVEFGEGQVKGPGPIQDDSGEPMEMDVIAAKYFKFLKND